MSLLGISAMLMLVSTVALYFYVRNLLQTEVQEELYSTEARIESALLANKNPFVLPPVIEIDTVSEMGREILKDTLIYDPSQDEIELFRELCTYKQINGRYYKITLRTLVVESEDILIAIVLSYIIIIGLVFSFLLYFSRSNNQNIWQPFFHNLERMKNFSLNSRTPIALASSNILEFSELNQEIRTLTDKVRSDYENLKQFTEDVSHEMQTPLAIIQAKIENIINTHDITNEQYEQLTSIQKDIKRLTQLNQRLTLITKIENKQFAHLETVVITELVKGIIQNFRELTTTPISYEPSEEILVEMDPYLAEIMCSNLISNAIKYGVKDGGIQILSGERSLSIANKGKEAIRKPEFLFNRFYKESTESKSTGLGLAIVKRICDLYGFQISYIFQEGYHLFKVDFRAL